MCVCFKKLKKKNTEEDHSAIANAWGRDRACCSGEDLMQSTPSPPSLHPSGASVYSLVLFFGLRELDLSQSTACFSLLFFSFLLQATFSKHTAKLLYKIKGKNIKPNQTVGGASAELGKEPGVEKWHLLMLVRSELKPIPGTQPPLSKKDPGLVLSFGWDCKRLELLLPLLFRAETG